MWDGRETKSSPWHPDRSRLYDESLDIVACMCGVGAVRVYYL